MDMFSGINSAFVRNTDNRPLRPEAVQRPRPRLLSREKKIMCKIRLKVKDFILINNYKINVTLMQWFSNVFHWRPNLKNKNKKQQPSRFFLAIWGHVWGPGGF